MNERFVYELGECHYGVGAPITGMCYEKIISAESTVNTWFDMFYVFKYKNNEFVLACRDEDGTTASGKRITLPFVTSASYHIIANMLSDEVLKELGLDESTIYQFKHDEFFGGPITYTREEIEQSRKGKDITKTRPEISMESYTKFAKATQYMVEHGAFIKEYCFDRYKASPKFIRDFLYPHECENPVDILENYRRSRKQIKRKILGKDISE